jgi:AmiR/NasT family two-component response regulator
MPGLIRLDRLAVALGDAHQMRRQLLRTMLTGLGTRVVGEAASVIETHALIRATAPDVLLLATDMQGFARAAGGFAGRSTSGTPPTVVLLLPQPTRSAVLAVRRLGFSNVLGYPLAASALHRHLLVALIGRETVAKEHPRRPARPATADASLYVVD